MYSSKDSIKIEQSLIALTFEVIADLNLAKHKKDDGIIYTYYMQYDNRIRIGFNSNIHSDKTKKIIELGYKLIANRLGSKREERLLKEYQKLLLII